MNLGEVWLMTLSLEQFIVDYQNSFCFVLNEKKCNDVSSDFSSFSIFPLTLYPAVLTILDQILRNFTFTTTNSYNQEASNKGNEIE